MALNLNNKQSLTDITSNGYLSSSGRKVEKKKRAFYKDYIELHRYVVFRLYHEWDVTSNTKWLSVMWAENDHHPTGCSEMLLPPLAQSL